jgi:hypothetical protein
MFFVAPVEDQFPVLCGGADRLIEHAILIRGAANALSVDD